MLPFEANAAPLRTVTGGGASSGLFKPCQHRRPIVLKDKHDVQQSVVRLRGEGDRQRRPGPAEIHDLDQQELAGKHLAVHVDLEALGPRFLEIFLQLFATHVDAERLGRLGTAMRNGLGNRAEAHRLEKPTLAPRATRHADIEALGLCRAQVRYQSPRCRR